MTVSIAGTTGIITPDATIGTSDLSVTGNAPSYTCRAWVNFDGEGTVSIRESGNVSSITDNGTGYYTVNFATAMPDNDYSVQVSGQETGNEEGYSAWISTKNGDNFNDVFQSSSVEIETGTHHVGGVKNEELRDINIVCIAVFR